MREEVAIVDRDRGQAFESAKVCLLPLGLLRISRACRDLRGEVPDPFDVVFREKSMAQLFQVKPFVRRTLQSPVVEVEAVDVHVGRHVGTRYALPEVEEVSGSMETLRINEARRSTSVEEMLRGSLR